MWPIPSSFLQSMTSNHSTCWKNAPVSPPKKKAFPHLSQQPLLRTRNITHLNLNFMHSLSFSNRLLEVGVLSGNLWSWRSHHFQELQPDRDLFPSCKSKMGYWISLSIIRMWRVEQRKNIRYTTENNRETSEIVVLSLICRLESGGEL